MRPRPDHGLLGHLPGKVGIFQGHPVIFPTRWAPKTSHMWMFPKNSGTPKSSILVGFSIVVPLFLETPMFVGSRIFVQDKPTCLQAAWLGLHVLHLLGILRHDMIPFLPQSWFSAKLPKIPKGKLYLGDDPSFHWTMISKKLGS